MTEKSAVIVVVEGYSDMASIGTILKEYLIRLKRSLLSPEVILPPEMASPQQT